MLIQYNITFIYCFDYIYNMDCVSVDCSTNSVHNMKKVDATER